MIRARGLCVGTVLLAAVASAPAAEYYVNRANTSGTELGTRQSPFRTVQAAVNAASDADEIRVAAGTYAENVRIVGKDVLLYGGYSADWVRDVAANPTTISSPGGNAVITLIEADATIDGFRITGGTGSTEELPFGYHGGGIYSRDGSPTISNNVIEGNDVRSGDPPFDYYLGGGMHVSNAPSATIVNNVVRGNYAGRGGGISVGGQAALIQGNTIENNVAVGDHGGGLFIGVVEARVTQNVIRGNEVGRDLGYGWGGGLIVFNTGNSAELSYNTVYENFAAAYGSAEFIDEGAQADIHHELIYRNVSKDGCEAVSAIAVDGGDGVGSQATIDHCTVVNNVCEGSTRGNGLQVEGGSVVRVSNSIFWGNAGDDFQAFNSTLEITYTRSEEGYAGEGNFSEEPRFVDEDEDDYHLADGSPCIDAANPAAPFDREPGANGGRADVGAYGNTSEATASDGSGGGDGNSNSNSNGDDNANANGDGNGGSNANANSGGDGGSNANANGNGGNTANTNADGGGNANVNSGGDGGNNANANGDDGNGRPNEGDGSTPAVGLCPPAATMLFSIALVGVGLRRRPAAGRARGHCGR